MAATTGKKHIIHAELRTDIGGRRGRRLRRQGNLPAVLYGHQQQPINLLLNQHDFSREFKHISENSLIDLHCDGQVHQVLVKDFDINLIKNKLIHIDFYKVVAGHLLKTHVPVKFNGVAIGAKVGGLVQHNIDELLVECLPRHLPDIIEVDISHLRLDQSIHVRDLAVPEGVTIITPGEQSVVHIAVPRGVSDNEEETAE